MKEVKLERKLPCGSYALYYAISWILYACLFVEIPYVPFEFEFENLTTKQWMNYHSSVLDKVRQMAKCHSAT